MAEETAAANGIEIVYETIGDPDATPLLLVMGLGMQLINWDRELCEQLAGRGFRVIRFDNRDAGRSTEIAAPVPNLMRLIAGLKVAVPYRLDDMADDAISLLDHIGVEAAHVAGVSMGGMIAQTMAIRRPERVLSLTSIMSTTGSRRVGRPKLRVWGTLLRRAPREKDAFVEHFVRMFKMIGSKGFPVDEQRLREEAALTYERGHHPAGTARQLAAIVASGDRTARLRELTLPATVIHGRSDPLIPFSGGAATARAIPHARMIAIPGMGHDLPPAVWPQVMDAMAENAELATGAPVQARPPA